MAQHTLNFLSSSIDAELHGIRERLDNSMLRRIAHANEEKGDVISRYRKIETLFRHLQVRCSLTFSHSCFNLYTEWNHSTNLGHFEEDFRGESKSRKGFHSHVKVAEDPIERAIACPRCPVQFCVLGNCEATWLHCPNSRESLGGDTWLGAWSSRSPGVLAQWNGWYWKDNHLVYSLWAAWVKKTAWS